MSCASSRVHRQDLSFPYGSSSARARRGSVSHCIFVVNSHIYARMQNDTAGGGAAAAGSLGVQAIIIISRASAHGIGSACAMLHHSQLPPTRFPPHTQHTYTAPRAGSAPYRQRGGALLRVFTRCVGVLSSINHSAKCVAYPGHSVLCGCTARARRRQRRRRTTVTIQKPIITVSRPMIRPTDTQWHTTDTSHTQMARAIRVLALAAARVLAQRQRRLLCANTSIYWSRVAASCCACTQPTNNACNQIRQHSDNEVCVSVSVSVYGV